MFGKSPQQKELDRLAAGMRSSKWEESLAAVTGLVDRGSADPAFLGLVSAEMPKWLKALHARTHFRGAFVLAGLIDGSIAAGEASTGLLVGLLRHPDIPLGFYAAARLGLVAGRHPHLLPGWLSEIRTQAALPDLAASYPAWLALGEIGYQEPALIQESVPFMTGMLTQADAALQTFTRVTQRTPLAAEGAIGELLEVARRAQDLFVGLEVPVILMRVARAAPGSLQDRILPAMRSLFGDPNRVARAAAAYQIGLAGMVDPDAAGEFLPSLAAVAGDPEAGVRLQAALALGMVGGRRRDLASAVAVHLAALLDDGDGSVRGGAAVALRYLAVHSPDSVAPLLPAISRMLDDNDVGVRGSASLSLHLLSLAGTVLPGDLGERARAAGTGADARRGAATVLHMVSRCPDPEFDTALLPLMEGLLQDGDGKVRARGALALKNVVGAFPERALSAVPAIADLLGDRDGSVRMQAAFALAEMADHRPDTVRQVALPRLLELLEDGADQRVRSAVALALGKLI
jgi:HEAT repeat protein